MKVRPIKLEIKGLNSFIEKQVIDFDELTKRGLFGIFGPTGSGKSTILDGITLALYGEVSRKSSNYINTNCDSTSVEFTFQISGADTRRYVVSREFKRKKDGAINSGKCKLIDITDGDEEILADKKTLINSKIKEIIGLGIEDFTRTVVLPQGKFSEFLKLEGKSRRDMLERLFNLQQYGDNLSFKLSREIAKEKEKNSVLLGQLKGYEDVSNELLQSKEEAVVVINKNLKIAKENLEKIEVVYKENEELWNLQLELIGYNEKESLLDKEKDKIEKSKEIVSLGEAAARVLPYIKSYDGTLKELESCKIELEETKKCIDKIKEEREILEKKWTIAKEDNDNKKPNLLLEKQKAESALEDKKALDIILKKVIELKGYLNEIGVEGKKKKSNFEEITKRFEELEKKEKEIDETISVLKIDDGLKENVQKGILEKERFDTLSKTLDKTSLKIKEVSVAIENNNKLKEKLLKDLEVITKVVDEKSNMLEVLLKAVPGTQEDLLNMQKLVSENKEKWNLYEKLSKEVEEGKNKISLLKEVIEESNAKIFKEENLLNTMKDNIEVIRKEILAHNLREQLKDGEICPVCGSKEHFKENIAVVEIADVEKIEKDIKIKEATIKEYNEKLAVSKANILNEEEKLKENEEAVLNLGTEFKKQSPEEMEIAFNKLKSDIDDYSKRKETLEKEINISKEEKSKLEKKVSNILVEIETLNKQITDLDKEKNSVKEDFIVVEKNLEVLIKATDIENFKEKWEEIKSIEEKREKLLQEVKKYRNDKDKLGKEKNEIQKSIDELREKYIENKSIIVSLEENSKEKIQAIEGKVGDVEDIVALVASIDDKVKSIEETYKKLENEKTEKENEFTTVNEKYSSILGKKDQLLNRKVEEEKTIDEKLTEEKFISIEDVRKNERSNIEILNLKKEIEVYNDTVSKLKGAIESVKKKIGDRILSEEDWEKIKNSKISFEEEYKVINDNKVRVDEEIKNIKNKLKDMEGLLSKKEALDHKLALLSDLEKLFKGKKFVEFVAAHQLKYISMEASKRLKEITNGNYGLEVDENGKFIIRDYKNGGAERDATTLSGGETFLASLALALALSAQIQLKGTAPLELFFLDEGFGTLDDNLLDVVMSSLERIHNDKLKIGIISHVESIKNRVPMQLVITPAEAGRGGSKVEIVTN